MLGFAESNVQPLSTYATGLLAGAMEEQDIAMNFKDANARLVNKFVLISVFHPF